MSIEMIANFSYIVSAALFIFGLKMLGSPATARRGNLLSSLGMLIAVVAGLTANSIVSFEFIIGGMVLGTIIGALAARQVEVREYSPAEIKSAVAGSVTTIRTGSPRRSPDAGLIETR